MAGGDNIAKDIIPGTFGTVNPEQIVASNPDQIIVTGGEVGSSTCPAVLGGVGLARDSRRRAQAGGAHERRPTGVRAVEDGRSTPSGTSSTTAPISSSRSSGWRSGCIRICSPTSIPRRRSRNCTRGSCPSRTRPGYWVSLAESMEDGRRPLASRRIAKGRGRYRALIRRSSSCLAGSRCPALSASASTWRSARPAMPWARSC